MPEEYKMTEEEHDYFCSIPALVEFGKSSIWKDMVTFLMTQLEARRAELEAFGVTVEEAAYLRGQIKQLKMLLSLPQSLINNLEMEEHNERDNEQDK